MQAKYSRLTNERAEKLVEVLRTKATLIKNVPPVFNYVRDSKDKKYINLAVAAGAEYIVSRDTHLLDFMRDFDDDSKEFWQKLRPLKIIQHLEFTKIVEEKTKDFKP